MKKLITLALALILTLAASLSAAAESSALDAFRQLTGEDAGQTSGTAKTSEQYLNEVMQGNYASAFLDTATAQTAAGELDGLSAVTTQDIAAYAAAHGLSVAQVRNAYYRALANVLRAVAKDFHGDLLITENGIGTGDDTRRVEFIRQALAGVQDCLAEGLPIKGYLHWSLLDNFEWQKGFSMTFGLIAVDRANGQTRHPKPSLAFLGSYAAD